MAQRNTEERINWLSETLASQRGQLVQLLSRLRGIALRVGTNLSLHKKFVKLMDQVADEKEKELGIIDKIEALEKRHHDLRKQNMLQRIALEAEARQWRLRKENDEQFEREMHERPAPSRLSWLEILFLYLLFSPRSGFLRFGFLQRLGPLAGVDLSPKPVEKTKPDVK